MNLDLSAIAVVLFVLGGIITAVGLIQWSRMNSDGRLAAAIGFMMLTVSGSTAWPSLLPGTARLLITIGMALVSYFLVRGRKPAGAQMRLSHGQLLGLVVAFLMLYVIVAWGFAALWGHAVELYAVFGLVFVLTMCAEPFRTFFSRARHGDVRGS